MIEKIFISYSRKDKIWVKGFVKSLDNVAKRSPWYDAKLLGGVDWWRSICEQIRNCDVFIYVGTEDSLASVFCQGELQYAIKLNKPIIPIMLHRRERPDEDDMDAREIEEPLIDYDFLQIPTIVRKRKQLLAVYHDDDLVRILVDLEKSLSEIHAEVVCGEEYILNNRVPEPECPQEDPEDAEGIGHRYFQEGNYMAAIEKFDYVLSSEESSEELKDRVRPRRDDCSFLLDRNRAYRRVADAVNYILTDATHARSQWDDFKQKYNAKNLPYDPDNIEEVLKKKEKELEQEKKQY